MCETGMGRGQLVFVLAPPEAVIGLQVSPIELVVRPLLFFRVFVSFPFFRALALALVYLDWGYDPAIGLHRPGIDPGAVLPVVLCGLVGR